jgi:hypothetical protein
MDRGSSRSCVTSLPILSSLALSLDSTPPIISPQGLCDVPTHPAKLSSQLPFLASAARLPLKRLGCGLAFSEVYMQAGLAAALHPYFPLTHKQTGGAKDAQFTRPNNMLCRKRAAAPGAPLARQHPSLPPLLSRPAPPVRLAVPSQLRSSPAAISLAAAANAASPKASEPCSRQS